MLNNFQFGARAMSITEEEFAGVLKRPLNDALYEEYCASGQPEPVDDWLRPRLKDLFQYLVSPPQWIEEQHKWPYLNDRPMVFIHQYAFPQDLQTETLGTGTVLYIFGGRVPLPEYGEGRYRVEYTTVAQDGEWAAAEKQIAAKRAKEDADEEARLALREQKKREWEARSANEPPKGKKKKS